MIIQLGQTGLTCDRNRIAQLSDEFRDRHYVFLPRLLEPSLMDFIQRRLQKGLWKTKIHPGIAEEYILDDLPALSLLDFVTNFGEFRELIEKITGCGPLRRFRGRVYRKLAVGAHYDKWHDDDVDGRLVAMSLNLSPELFQGGLLVLREWQSKRILAEIANTGLGDALVFRLSPELQHRVSDVEGDNSKIAFAGWFDSEGPEWFAELRANSPRG